MIKIYIYIFKTPLQLASSDASILVRLSEEANGISEEALLNIKTVVSCNGEKAMIEVRFCFQSGPG